jgi:heat shock protein HtpX
MPAPIGRPAIIANWNLSQAWQFLPGMVILMGPVSREQVRIMPNTQRPPVRLAVAHRNIAHSVILIGGICLITALCAYVLWGRSGVLWTFVFIFGLLLVSPRIAPEIIIRMYGAQRVSPAFGGQLLRTVEELARRADLPVTPQLYVIPSQIMNAFAAGTQTNSLIAVTHGMLRTFTPREIAGVLAHEMAHIRHNDLWVMNLADTLSRFTHVMSMFGVLLFLLNLPLVLMGGEHIPWLGIILLYFAPTLSSLLQLGLSRAREYGADLEGARLSGDPEGLVSALAKIEHYQSGIWESVFLPGRRVPVPSILRTHPPTEERIARLRELQEFERGPVPVVAAAEMAGYFQPGRPRPAYRFSGLWY